MTTFHAVARIDHQTAQVVQFDADTTLAHTVKAQTHHTRQHGSAVRSEHEFFGHVCDALEGIAEVLTVGPHTGMADFEHYVKKHRPQTAARIVGYQVVDHPTDNQLVALAREFFLKYDRTAGTPAPG